MRKFTALILIMLPFIGFAQSDKLAEEVLNKLSKKIDSFQSLYIEYNILTENKQEQSQTRQDGKVTAQKNKFKIVTNKNLEVYCDGVTKWTFMTDVQEINIQKVDPNADDILSDPIKFLTGQRKDFKYKYKGEVDEDGKKLTEIDYYPKNIKLPYSIIRLHIDEKALTPYSIKYIGKDGVHYTIKLKNYLPNVDVSTVQFNLDVTKYPNVEIVDLR